MNIEQEIRVQIEKNKGLKMAVGEINNHLSILEGLLRNERDDVQKQVAEAYQRGLEDGKKATWGLVADASSVEYQRGLDDAWDAARKIAQQWEEDTDTEHRLVIDDSIRVTLDSMTASEAIAKLKAYEEKQKADDEIKVGDVVTVCKYPDKYTFVVTKVSDECVWGVDANGSWNFWGINEVIKTNKHFDIDKILEAMKE